MSKTRATFVICVVLGLLQGCAKLSLNSYDEAVYAQNTWLPIVYAPNATMYYAPYKTTYKSDGSVVTLMAAVRKSDNKRGNPTRVEINCNGLMQRNYHLDGQGNWTLKEDWTNSPGLANSLCINTQKFGSEVRFVGLTEDKKMPNNYSRYFWEYQTDYSNPVNKGKVIKIYTSSSDRPQWKSFFLTFNCSDRRYAFMQSADEKNLNWGIEPPANSIFGYLLTQACGEKLSSKASTAPNLKTDRGGTQDNQYVQKSPIRKEATPHPLNTDGPVIRSVQVNFESSPNGATVKDVKSGQTVGVTPFVVNYNLDVTKLKAGRCTEISALSFEWVSGAKTKTPNPLKVCMSADDRFSISMQRPKAPGVQADIDYQVKLQQLKIQQETLAVQQRQAAAAEQQARAQQEQAAAEANQAKSAQDALLLQMFQGGSMIKKSPTRLPTNCSPTVGGGYSCY